MALGAFLAGLLLAETEFSLQVESDIAPYRGLLLGLFFMTVCTSWWQLVVVKLRGELMEREKSCLISKSVDVFEEKNSYKLKPTPCVPRSFVRFDLNSISEQNIKSQLHSSVFFLFYIHLIPLCSYYVRIYNNQK